jgi:hypothetical protein
MKKTDKGDRLCFVPHASIRLAPSPTDARVSSALMDSPKKYKPAAVQKP